MDISPVVWQAMFLAAGQGVRVKEGYEVVMLGQVVPSLRLARKRLWSR